MIDRFSLFALQLFAEDEEITLATTNANCVNRRYCLALLSFCSWPESDAELWRKANSEQLKRDFYFNATINAVTMIFASASGSRNFQPNAINWS